MEEILSIINSTGVDSLLFILLLIVWKSLREDNEAEEERHRAQEEKQLLTIENNTAALEKLTQTLERRLSVNG